MSNLLYLEVVTKIKDSIIKGIYKPGDKIKSESELMTEFSTTKLTIRKSLSLLCNEGYIYSIPSKGYFVQRPKVNNYTLVFDKFDKLNIQIDNVQLNSVEVISNRPGIFIKLQLSEQDRVVEVKRFLFSGNMRIAYEKIYMKYTPSNPIVEQIINFANYTKGLDTLNLFNLTKQMKITALLAGERFSSLLKLNDSDVIYEIDELVHDKSDNSVFSYSEYYVAAKYLTLVATQQFGS